MPRYILKDGAYNIPEDAMEDFERENPDAMVEYEEEGVLYNVPINDREAFLAEAPNATYTKKGYTLEEAAPEPSEKPKFGLSSGIPTIADTTKAKIEGRNVTPFASIENQPQVITTFGEGVKQGKEQLIAGGQYGIGEAVASVLGTSRDDIEALAEIERLQAEGKDVAEETKNVTDLSTMSPIVKKGLELMGAGKIIGDAEKITQRNRTIQKALKENGGDVDKAKVWLESRAGKQTWADEMMAEAEYKMAQAKPTKGWAWIGEMIPQMVLPATGMMLTGVTGIPTFASVLGGVNMGVLTASTAGSAMAEARQAGASNSQVWASGIANGAVELLTEKIPYNRYVGRITDAAKNSAKQALGKAVTEVGSPANKELKDLLSKANKRLDGKLFSGKNVEDYMGDLMAEGLSEATAEGLQTILPILYENPENYPTFMEILGNSLEGAKGGVFMGMFLGGASKAAEHRMNRARRKAQGYVDVAEVTTPDGKDEIVEVVRNEQDQPVFLWNGEQIPISENNVKQRHQFNFEDFERGQFQLEEDEAYENGKTLETPAEMTDANNMYEIALAEIRDHFELGENSTEDDIKTLLGGNLLRSAFDVRESEPKLSNLILKLAYATATRDGIIDAARDRISEESAQAEAIIDYRKNKTDGMIHPATLKTKDANGNDRQVYVVSGNIVTFEDGTINTQESDNDIIIQDAVTGKPEFATAKDLLRAEQALDPEVEKQNVRNTIADTIATEVENKMNNVLSFNVGDAYNVIGADGAEHSVQVMADNGDGSVMASIDNAEAVAMPKSEIQQLSNEYNMNRARLANEAQKEVKQSEKMMQESQNVEPTNMVEQTTEAPAEVVPERIVPTLKDGNPDFNAMDAEMFVDEYVSRYGEDSAVKIARKNISNARENIAKIDKKIDDITDPNQMEGLYVQRKSAEVQIARYSEILERLGASEDANESEADQRNRLRNDAGNRITALFPDGMPNVESFILADIATGNRIRWSDKVTNGVVTSRGLGAELGLSDSKQERTRRLPLIGKDAMTPEEYAESLRERLDAVGIRYDESSLRDAVLGVYQSVDSRKGAWDALENMSKKMQEPQTDMDWEDMQQQMAYNKAQNDNAPALPDMPDLGTIEEEAPISGEEAAEIEAQEQTEDYKLSDEVDENGRQFVLASNGNIVFGNIDEESGLTPAPILLSEGIITNPATNDGYGLVHIEARHGGQIRNAGYPSVVSFIEEVAKNYQIIKEGKNRNGNNTYMLQLTDKHNNTLMVELSGDGTYWNINTAGIFKTSYGKNRKEVYNRQTTAKQPAEVVETSQSVESNGTQTPSSLIDVSTPKSSESKDTTSEPQKQEVDEKILQEEQKVNVNPTDGQKEAGNYKKGHVVVDGFNITIEQPKGSVRSGVDADGKEWSITMNNTYGYIRGTEGVDGDHIDVFLSDNLDNWGGEVFVVDQINTDGSFDEHKVMYGFNSIDEAQQAYLSNYSEGWQGLGAITGVSKDEFKKWIESSHRKTKPFAEYKSVKATEGQSAESVEAADDEQILFRGGEKSVQEEVTETIFATAKEKFGTTYDMREAGYILPDGSMLDFSGKHEIRGADTSFLNGQRSVDHRAIQEIAYDFDENETGVETDMGDFLDRGAIRIDYNTGAINLNVAPTKAQKDRLKRLIERNDGDVYIDFGKGWDTEHYVEYESTRASRVLGDIDRYFNEGIKPQGNIRFRSAESAESAPVFYSNAEYAVNAVKQEKATPEQWLKMIEKNGGLKAGEDKWLGLSDWLKSSDKKTLTKQEVLDFIKENQIQIEEVVYGSLEETPRFKELRNEYKSLLVENDYNNERTFEAMVDKYGEDFELAFEGWGNDLHINDYYGTEAADAFLDARDINDTRIQYTTDGLDNKREIALTVPTIESWNESDEIHFGDAGNGRAIAWVRFGETTDADGNRVLVIDEVQSKRHQEGREKGYVSEEVQEAQRQRDYLYEKMYRTGLTIEENERYYQLGEFIKNNFGIVPSAPFEKNWAELAMKRMLRYAAENGFDKVAWTTGEQQAERYDISKSVDNIKSEDNNVEETSDGTLIVKNITIYAGGSVHNLFVDANGIVRGREYDGKKLSDIVGKPLAEKLMEQGDFELEGDGLRIGGEGMKAFYDQMIPSFMNKYGKKWGVKVGEVTMPSLEENNTMHSIDVTDAMRESVMQGQPMFRLSNKEQTKLAGWYDNIAERYNVSGNIQVAPSREVFEQTLRDNGVAEDKLAEYDKAAYIPDKDIYLINGDSINDDIEAERALFHEVWHKLTREIVSLQDLKWLAKNIPSNRLEALSNAMWSRGYDNAEATIDELISIVGENYVIADTMVDGKPISALEAYLNGHISLKEATELAKGVLTDAAKEYSDIWDKIFYEAQRNLLHYKNAYYERQRDSRGRVGILRETVAEGSRKETVGKSQAVFGGEAQMAVGAGREDAAATRAEQRQRAIIAEATNLAESLGVKMTIIEDLNDINDSNPEMLKSKRGSKAWHNINTDEVVFVAPNATSVFDAMQSVWHEVVAHKGLRDVVGREKFDAFLMKVFNAADTNTRSKIVALAAKKGWDFKLATEEYMADLAEEGFDKRENRDFWQKVRDFFMDMLREAKIAIGYNITDNDMRYMLWRTYQKQKSQGAMAVAEDVVMQQKLGVGNFRTRPAGESMTEEEQIIADAKANGTYLKAPNGKDTNLTPKQWVQVRTKAFKEWFGDWEKAARIEKLRKSKDAKITGNEIEASEDLKQYKKNAQMYGRTLQGEYTNADTGAVISLQRGRHNGGINEVLQHNYKDVAHLQSVAAIPQIIENGIYIESQPNTDTNTNPNVTEYQLFVCGLNIGGEDYTVLAKVAVDDKGNRYYDHNLVSIEKGKLIDIANNEQSAISSGFGTTPDTKSTTNSQRKYKELISLLQTNSSKIVDANGEPKVVEHSTWNDDFYIFDIDRLGESSGDEGLYGAGFYFGNVGHTKLYGDRAIKGYLSAKNPLILPEYNIMGFFDYLVDNFDKQGLRDIIVKQSNKSIALGKVIDVIKEVQTNHRNGEYNELIESMKQYWTPLSAEDRVIEQSIFRKVGFAFYRSLESFIEDNIGRRAFSEGLRNAGFDGVVFNNTEYVVFNPNQIKSATDNVGTFDANSDDIRFRTKDEATTPSPDEKAIETLSKEEKLQKDLKVLRKAVRGTKSVRKALAGLVAGRVRREVTDDIINVMGKSEFNALVKQIQDADVDMDIVKPLERISEIITDLNIKDKENKIFNLLSLKVQGENKSGVSIAKSVDNSTRKLFNILASDISRPKDEIRAAYEGKVDDLILNMALDISEKYQQAKSLMRDNADINNEIKDVKEENTALRKQRAELNKDGKVDEAKALGVDIQHNKEKISALEAERLANKEQMEYYLGYVQRALTYSAMMGQGSYKTLMYHNMMHKVDMVNMAIRDVDTGQTLSVLRENPTRFEKAKENVRALLFSPARSLNYLLKRITVNAPNGEGRLYDYFVRGKNGYIAASENFYEGYNEFKSELNAKAKSVFGKSYKDVLADSNNPSDVTITVTAGDRVQEVQLTIGQAMYLYMVNKMADGKVKLTKMGIFDADVEAVKNSLPARYITFADWLQNKFLPKKREKYNDTHLKVFGTEMASIDGYVPMKVKKDEVYQEVDGTEQDGDRLPTTITGSIINRRRNGIILDLTTNALDLMLTHGEEMEHWNAYTPVVRDMNSLLSSTKFRLMLNNKSPELHKALENAAKIASGQYTSKVDGFSKAWSWASKGVISSKISFRLWTAMKQVLSFPAFMAYSASVGYQKRLMASLSNPYAAWKWGMENLPILHKRWNSRSLGNEKLAEVTEGAFGKILDGTAKVGMIPNAFVDALTCAIGAKAVYDYKVKVYQAQMYSKEDAEYRALIDATVAFNESQQSNEGLFLSQLQANKDGLSVMVSTFNNSNFGYLRKQLEALRELTRKRDAEVAYLRDRYIEQGMTAEDAASMAEVDVRKAKRTAVLSAAMYGFLLNTIWAMGSNVFKYFFADDDDDESLTKDSLVALGIAPVRNTTVGSWIDSAVNGFAVNPSLLLNEVNTLWESIKADENKRWDKTVAYLAIKMAASAGAGVDIETLVRWYEGIEGMIADGVDVEDIMALVSAPRSQALMAAREPKENESVAEYQERMAKIDRRIDSRISDSLRGTWLKNYYMYQLADKYNLSAVRDDFGRVRIPEYQNYLDEAKVTSDREKSYKKNNIPESDMKAFRELPEYKRMTITDHYKKDINKTLKDLKGDISESTRSEYEQKLYDTMGEMLEKIKELESSNK